MKGLQFLILASAGAAMVAAGSSSLSGTGSPPPGPSVDQIVSARKAAMAMSLFVLGDLKTMVEKGAPSSEQAFLARSLANWAIAIPGMFPPGTAGSDKPFDKHAKPEIWTQWPTFESFAAEYITATGKLRDLATAGDTGAIKDQLGIVRRSCNGCHEAFRFDPHARDQKK